MHTNDTNAQYDLQGKIIYPELSYTITGICFKAHNEIGRFGREKQYGDFLEREFAKINLPFKREVFIPEVKNILDFIVGGKIALELKAIDMVRREDYYQLQRYLQSANLQLGLLINFRSRYLKPIRIVKIDTDTRKRFV